MAQNLQVSGVLRLLSISVAGLALSACVLARGGLSLRPLSSADSYAVIDAHALAAPAEARASVASLAAYLTAPAASEREKARAIYRWITAHVDYAQDEALGNVTLDGRPEAVLVRGTAVCA
jgi:transglutaminase-like putative cysteine protease